MRRESRKDLYMLQVRLFRQAQITWQLSAKKCSELFNTFDVYKYIETCYDFFHIQGDDANIADISAFLKRQGADL